MNTNTKSAVYDLTMIGVMTAALEAGKLALSFLPNVEIVTLLIILYTLCFGRKVFYAIAAFILLEGFLYGFGLWFVMYLYTWPLLALITYLFRKKAGVLFVSILSAFFGLFFGALCAVPYLFISGVRGAFVWWTAGIPYDIVHCISNFILAFVLFKPLKEAMGKCVRGNRETIY